MDLKRLFPSGEFSTSGDKFMVKEGCYFWSAAEMTDGEWKLTEFGERLTGSGKIINAPKRDKVPTKQAQPNTAADKLSIDTLEL